MWCWTVLLCLVIKKLCSSSPSTVPTTTGRNGLNTDHVPRLFLVSLQDVSILEGQAQIVAGASSHLPSSQGARTHEDDYNETETPHMLAIIKQRGSTDFLHRALLVCSAFPPLLPLNSPSISHSAIFNLGMSLKITISPSTLKNSFSFSQKVK